MASTSSRDQSSDWRSGINEMKWSADSAPCGKLPEVSFQENIVAKRYRKVMSDESEQPDLAAVFGCALSLWRECMRRSRSGRRVNLSDCYGGGDEFMRVVMRAGIRFEMWACRHIAFEALDDVWPYFLEAKFGEACVELKDVTSLNEFSERDCLQVALNLRLPVKVADGLPIPVDVVADNPVADSDFRMFRIQTVRESNEHDCEPFTSADDPFDSRFSSPFFGFYGVFDDGLLEHIADFDTYAAAVSLARKLAPGIQFADRPHSR